MTAALYPCEITHVRAHPVRRTFRYRSYLWLADLGDPPRVPLALRPFARFRSRDHLGDPACSIRANVDAYLAGQGISLAGGRVLMLGHAAALGYVFNPLTVFWCHRADGSLAAVIAEVHNTYGQRHAYLLHPDDRGRAARPVGPHGRWPSGLGLWSSGLSTNGPTGRVPGLAHLVWRCPEGALVRKVRARCLCWMCS